MNPVAQSLTGWSEEEAVGKPLKDIFNVVHEMTREEVENLAAKVVETGRAVELGDFTLLIAKDGTDIPLEVTANPITGEQGNTVGAVMVFHDIRERRRTEAETRILQAQVQEAQKVEAISTLAGGMAHEYNNALSAIAGSVELLKMDLAEDEDILAHIEPISRSTRRMAKLTSQLLAFARGGKYGPKTLCLNDFVAEALPIFRDAIDPAISIETDVPSSISCVEADPTQMQMVISSVLSNASEATNGSGRIIISATEEEVDEEFAKKHPDLKQGRYVHLSVRDSGNGMDEETRSRVFEPFFTTKFQGRGLGMAAVYGIIRNHYGGIWVDSEPGKGTVVHILLPCVGSEKTDAEKPKAELARGTGTILLIEDEEPLMRVTRKMLQRLGYRVLAARSGKEAVQTTTDYDGDIDLAILDVGLPDKWGTNVYELIREARPNLRVIVTSGYAMDGPAQELFKAGVESFIQKPYSLARLSEKVKEVLEKTPV
jgi:PAS domain S-box-containing protein